MKIASQALAIMGGLLRQMTPSPGDLEIIIPPVVQPTVVLRAPSYERQVGQLWLTSGIIQQSLAQATNAASASVLLCTLDKGLWDVTIDVSYSCLTSASSVVTPAYAVLIQDPDTGLGGEILTFSSNLASYADARQWRNQIALISPQQLLVSIRDINVVGNHMGTVVVWAQRLLD